MSGQEYACPSGDEPRPGISDDGSKVGGNVRDTDGIVKLGRRDTATGVWEALPTPTGGTCTQSFPGYPNVTWSGAEGGR